jgi:hypothetical protein
MTDRTPTYRIETKVAGAYWTPAGWDTKHYGRPNDERLAEYVEQVETSTRPGGVNEHLGGTTILSARIVHQFTGETVATYKRSPFMTLREDPFEEATR